MTDLVVDLTLLFLSFSLSLSLFPTVFLGRGVHNSVWPCGSVFSKRNQINLVGYTNVGSKRNHLSHLSLLWFSRVFCPFFLQNIWEFTSKNILGWLSNFILPNHLLFKIVWVIFFSFYNSQHWLQTSICISHSCMLVGQKLLTSSRHMKGLLKMIILQKMNGVNMGRCFYTR